MTPQPLVPDDYRSILDELKAQVRGARMHAQQRANSGLVQLYWSIGRTIGSRQVDGSWGSGVLQRIADDLRAEFPEMKGFSRSNLQYMRTLAQGWPEEMSIRQQAVGNLPWGHITVLIDKLHDREARDWYAARALEHGWSRNVLMNQIMNRTKERTDVSATNFAGQLAPVDSDLAHQLAKDPYVFDFLDLTSDVAERELEQALMDRIVETLRELGAGFAFVGRQVHFDVSGDDFYLDLLFFHVEQLRYVVVELKTRKFQPEYAGKLGFYVALVDDRLRREAHAPTVGILICGSGNEHTVRYSLGRTASPMAVSTYTYESLPANEQAVLPNADQLAAALDWEADKD